MQHYSEMAHSVLTDLVNLFYPRLCCGCNAHLIKQEQNLCLNCIQRLPKTYFWDYDINPVEKLFWGKLPVHSACAFVHFHKQGHIQSLMHRLKYQGKSNVGVEMGRLFAAVLKEKEWFTDADFLVPIPLHPSKLLRRGYNQSAYIADGMSEVLNIETKNTALKRVVASESQTRKSRYDRAENVESVFKPSAANMFKNKTVVLIDDIITTGATLHAAGNIILEAGAARLYIATIAVA